MGKERRLGRGLEALLGKPDVITAEPTEETSGGVAIAEPENEIHPLALVEIDPNPYQPRRTFDAAELDQLAQSISNHGVMQPIVVRRDQGRYQVVIGERRLRACKKLGWKTVPAKIVQVDERDMSEMALIENLQRKDLNPLERALAFQSYIQKYKCSQEDLAKRVSMNRSTVANLIRLLELPEKIQDDVRKERLTAGHARALLTLEDQNQQEKFSRRVQAEGLSVRATEQLVRDSTESETDQNEKS
ncbi:MAG: ParB/RepB/Spo0J family partition protein, partial [Planctomycetales bacterium]